MGSIIAVLVEQHYVRVESSSVAQAACDTGLWDRRSVGFLSIDHFTVATFAFGNGPRITNHCLVRWSRAGIVRDGPIQPHFRLLLLVSDTFVGCKARRDPKARHLHGVSLVCWIAERRAKER